MELLEQQSRESKMRFWKCSPAVMDSYELLAIAVTNQAFHDFKCSRNLSFCHMSKNFCANCKSSAVNYFEHDDSLLDILLESMGSDTRPQDFLTSLTRRFNLPPKKVKYQFAYHGSQDNTYKP